MRRRIRVAVVAAALGSLLLIPARGHADPPEYLICTIPIENGHEAFDNRIVLDVAAQGGMHGAVLYCREVLHGHPDQSPEPKM